MDYDQPIPLAGDVLKQRIFSPLAYANVRRANVVAIAQNEMARLAGHYPLVWRKTGDEFRLVAIRSLLDDGRGHAPGTQLTLSFLSVLLRCYPFLYDPRARPEPGRPRFIDQALADEPGDVGAPVALADGRPSKAALQRLAHLDAAATSFAQTALISNDLGKRELLEPWSLKFDDVQGIRLEVPDLWIVRQAAAKDSSLTPVLQAHGIAAGDLIGLHRLSLFRAGTLLTQARAALQSAKSGTVTANQDGEAAPDVAAAQEADA